MDSPTTYDYINLGIALAGLLLALGALGWQAMTWLLSGPRVTVDMQIGGVGPGGLLLGPPGSDPIKWMGQFPPGAFTDPVVVAQVSNKGRMPVSIASVSAVFDLGVELKDLNNTFPSNPELPHRLEPYSDMTYLLPGVQVSAAASATASALGGRHDVGLLVQLGGGKQVRTKRQPL